MNNLAFRKTMENVRNHRDINLVTTEARGGEYLVSESNCHTTKMFSENLLALEIKKRKGTDNKPVYLVLTRLEIGKIIMYEFW